MTWFGLISLTLIGLGFAFWFQNAKEKADASDRRQREWVHGQLQKLEKAQKRIEQLEKQNHDLTRGNADLTKRIGEQDRHISYLERKVYGVQDELFGTRQSPSE